MRFQRRRRFSNYHSLIYEVMKKREKLGISYEQLAKETGLSRHSMYLLRTGKTKRMKASTYSRVKIWLNREGLPWE